MGKFRKHGSKHDRGPKKKFTQRSAKRDKIHGIKAGHKGIAAQYLTRAQSLKKLQLSLVDFRRLCILKGIYPRDPKKKPAGNDKTYYHIKDIRFLQHEPLMNKFWELKTYMKKYKKCVGRGDKDAQKRVEENKPEYTLQHLVRERYPTFNDAIRDLDDALSMVSLFDSLPTDQKNEIRADVIQESAKLIHEFFLYVVQTRSLQKCFASIKGYYFQASIGGETVTWLVPHKFAQELPAEVDFKVMSTFNEFYRTMLKFINFKLFSEEHFAYPPKFAYRRQASDMAKFYTTNTDKAALEAGKNQEAAENEKQEVEAATIQDFAAVSEEVQQMHENSRKNALKKGIFDGMRVFIQREVPFHAVYFVLKSGGAHVGWASLPGSPFKEADSRITHQIIDRPSSQFTMVEGREYIQPQWVLDSFNENMRLPIEPYLPDKTCPPHLSPFVDDAAEGYTPERREVLNRLAGSMEVGASSSSTARKIVGEEDGAEAVGAVSEDQFLNELQAEAKGVWASEFMAEEAEKADAADDSSDGEDQDQEAGSRIAEAAADAAKARTKEEAAKPVVVAEKKKSKAEVEAEEEVARRKAMMPKKHQRLFQRIEKGEKQKSDTAALLTQKKKKLAKGAKKK